MKFWVHAFPRYPLAIPSFKVNQIQSTTEGSGRDSPSGWSRNSGQYHTKSWVVLKMSLPLCEATVFRTKNTVLVRVSVVMTTITRSPWEERVYFTSHLQGIVYH